MISIIKIINLASIKKVFFIHLLLTFQEKENVPECEYIEHEITEQV